MGLAVAKPSKRRMQTGAVVLHVEIAITQEPLTGAPLTSSSAATFASTLSTQVQSSASTLGGTEFVVNNVTPPVTSSGLAADPPPPPSANPGNPIPGTIIGMVVGAMFAAGLFIGLIICSSGGGDATKALISDYNPSGGTPTAQAYSGGAQMVQVGGSSMARNV